MGRESLATKTPGTAEGPAVRPGPRLNASNAAAPVTGAGQEGSSCSLLRRMHLTVDIGAGDRHGVGRSRVPRVLTGTTGHVAKGTAARGDRTGHPDGHDGAQYRHERATPRLLPLEIGRAHV